MQVIQLSGYTEDEKRHIARLYLEKEVRAGCAIPENSVELTDGALDVVIKQYCRESGVRNLKKQLEKAYRKVALKLATSEHLRVRHHDSHAAMAACRAHGPGNEVCVDDAVVRARYCSPDGYCCALYVTVTEGCNDTPLRRTVHGGARRGGGGRRGGGQ